VPQACVPNRFALILLWVTPAFWSSNYIIARASQGVLTGHSLALGRWTVALLLMLPGVWRSRQAMREAARDEWKQMLALGALGMWICGAVLYIGGQRTSATNIGLIYAATPVGIAVLASAWLHERMAARQKLAMGLALLGVLLVVAQGEPMRILQARFGSGDLWVLVAAVGWVLYSVLLRQWRSRLGPRERLACITLGGVLVLLPATLLEWALVPVPAFTPRAALLIAAAGVLPGFISYQAYAWLVDRLGPVRCSIIMYLSPVYAAFLAWGILGEAPHWYHAAGALLILPSTWLVSRTGSR